MTVRYRIIQYEGPEDWLEKVLARSIDGCMEMADARIIAWQAKQGDIVEPHIPWPKYEAPDYGDDPFYEADALVEMGDRDPPIGE